MSIQIFANHAHVFPAIVNPNGTVDRLLRLLDICQIERAICFAPFSTQVEGTGLRHNEWLASELTGPSRLGRLYGFGTLDLKKPDVASQVRQIVNLGFRGIKMHPNAQEFDILCPAALEAYAAAQEHATSHPEDALGNAFVLALFCFRAKMNR